LYYQCEGLALYKIYTWKSVKKNSPQKIAPNGASRFDHFATDFYGNRKMIAEPLMTL
jgi:hypothetical protein